MNIMTKSLQKHLKLLGWQKKLFGYKHKITEQKLNWPNEFDNIPL